MNKILFDLYEAQPYGTSKYHGGGEYIKAIYKYILTHLLSQCEISVFYDDSRFLDSWILDSFSTYGINTYTIKDRIQIKDVISDYNPDIFYSGVPYHYKKEWFPSSVIIRGTIHGLRDIEMPCDLFSCEYYTGINKIKQKIKYYNRDYVINRNVKIFEECVNFLDEIICVSKHTKYSLISHYPKCNNKNIETYYTPEKIVVASKINDDNQNFIQKFGKYILILGGDRWIKNPIRACIAINNLYKKNLLKDYHVVVVGHVPKHFERYLNSEICRYTFLDYVSPSELEELYKYCDFFLYPSLNEGFGMPPIEAMKYGKTCIVSGICSLPEIYGNGVYYVNPMDNFEIENRILMAVNEKIDEKIIKENVFRIHTKQKADLAHACEFIVK